MFSLTKNDLIFCQKKLKRQLSFLKNNYFISYDGNAKSFFDVSMSANISDKYYAEVSNRVNTITTLSRDNELIPVFLTITLNGCFRDSLKANFKRFNYQDIKSLPVELIYKLNNNVPFTIRDLVSVLNYNFHKFAMRLKRNCLTKNFCYIRTFEPHRDGVPHVHSLIFIPKNSLKYVLRIYKELFYAKQNLSVDKLDFNQIKNGEINGFQWTLTNACGYVMKYITKTFINFNENDELDFLHCWYIKYKVRRFLTSRTKIPLWVFRKINTIKSMRDFTNINILKSFENSFCEWDFEKKYIYLKFEYTNEVLIYDDGNLSYYLNSKLLKHYEKLE